MRSVNEELLTAAEEAARSAGEVLRRRFGDTTLDFRAKSENDFVTIADRESEEAILGCLERRFPEHRILSEEAGYRGGTSGEFEWIVDPLDGTTNFLQRLPTYAVSIACRRGEQMLAAAILAPERGDLFTALRGRGAFWNGRRLEVSHRDGLKGAFLATGYPFRAKAALDVYLDIFRDVFLEARAIRRCGAAALDLAYTAAGVFDGFFEFRLSAWDVAAGSLVIEEAGGVVSDLDGGRDFLLSGNLLDGTRGVHADLLEVVGRHAGEAVLDKLVKRPSVADEESC
jgi:myo-inositol-1(or 4)-monophosphatase